MSQTFGLDEVTAGMLRLAESLRGHADHFTQLDQKLGDGDLGITAKKAADALEMHVKSADDAAAADLGKFIAASGMAVNRVASSTMGTLLATAAMRAGKVVKGEGSLTPQQLADMLDAAATGMQERGKANLGDKTILDAIFPAADAFRKAIEGGKPLPEAGDLMVTAAETGRDAVTPKRNKVGRAGWIGARTEGEVDPGCDLCVAALGALAGK